MKYSLKRKPIFNRESYLLDKAKGKKVLHLGAAQANDDNDLEKFDKYVNDGSFLHRSLTEVASQCQGIDYNEELVNRLKLVHGYSNIYVADLENDLTMLDIPKDYDLIVMGELIEHLSNPGLVLNRIQKLMTKDTEICITTPNSLAIKNWLFCMAGFESHDEDHVSLYTPRLLRKIIENNGFSVDEFMYFQSTYKPSANNDWNYFSRVRKSFASLLGFVTINICLRVRPAFADGLIMVAKIR